MRIHDDQGTLVSLDPSQLLGDGGEAYVYAVSNGAAKIYRRPDDPFYAGPEPQQVEARAGARRRIKLVQDKLPAFPQGLPQYVVTPSRLLYADPSQQEIAGYIMRAVKGAIKMKDLAKVQSRPAKMDNNAVLRVFANLGASVNEVHQRGIVIGDFNALNILVVVADEVAYLIDADSMQYGKWFCEAFTLDYVDPTICDPNEKVLRQAKPHKQETDWYAWNTMLFETLTFLHPYLGTYEPKETSKRLLRTERPLHRVTWFNQKFPGTKVPPFALPFKRFNDDWAQHWDQVFHHDFRGPCPPRLFSDTKWVKCQSCGASHCRSYCPECRQAAPVPKAAKKETIRGKVKVMKVFDTGGMILHATIQGGELRYLYHSNNEFKRENGMVVSQGTPDPAMRFAISGSKTVIGLANNMLVLAPGASPSRINVDQYRGGRPSFVANQAHQYWAAGGTLFRDDGIGTKPIGQVLANQTLLWVGPKFGVGFYQAGGLQRTLLFDAENPGINDQLTLPYLRGEILDMRCYFSQSKAWLLVAIQEQGRTMNRCFVLNRDGSILASAEAVAGEDVWLGSISGICAVDLPGKPNTSYAAFAAKDSGLVRVIAQSGSIVENAAFPDTEGFVDSSHELLFSPTGVIYVVDREEIRSLQLLP
jgi:hypothetical protein